VRKTSILIALACSVFWGCGGGDEDGKGSPGGAGGTAGGGGTGAVDGGSDPLVLVPPVALAANPQTDCPPAFQTAPADGQHDGFEVAGQSRGFYLEQPDASKYAGPRPLMVAFNGTGESGKTIYDRAQLGDFVARGFIVLAPDSIGNGTLWPVWDGLRQPSEESLENKDLEYFDSLVQCIAAHHSIDQKRIYVSGHSAGGIFTNRVLRARSALLAGGIPASGVFDYTAPDPAPELDAMAVLVTWGGDNDAYSGGTGGVTVPEFNFVEQATLASAYYEKSPKVDQVYCRGKNLGHAWLDAANDWMIDYLLGHPKGLAKSSPWKFAAPAASANFTCGEAAAEFTSSVVVNCGTSQTPSCHSLCQLVGDCAVENATVAPILGPQLEAIGFSGTDHTDCGGCLTQCDADAQTGGATDSAVLSCFDTESQSAACGAGIPGVMPFVDAANKCCKDQTSSAVCKRLCGTIKTNSAASALFPTCNAF
jgi:poly(3-hydroxybutyrate) depolymerase